MHAALEGDLRHFLVTEVFQMLGLSGASGRLSFERTGERVDVWLDQGRIMLATTDRAAVRLGEQLIDAGEFDESTLDSLLEAQRDTATPLGELVVTRGLASRAQVAQALGENVRRILFCVILWSGGRFRFESQSDPIRPSILPEIDLQRVLLDGLRIADELRATA